MMLRNYIAALFIIAGVLMLFFDLASLRERTQEGRRRPLRKAFGFFPRYGAREEYTARGWRYRNLMIAAQCSALLLMLLWWMTMPGEG
jgi:hypothetical protein